MILCLCEAVTDRVIRESVRDGAHSVREITARTGAGRGCGACACDVRRMLRDELARGWSEAAACAGRAGCDAVPDEALALAAK